MTHLVDLVMALPPWAVYLVVAALVFGESAAFVGLVLPGETALLLGGVLAASGRVSLPVVVVVAVTAAVTGDSVGYEIGRLGGVALRRSRLGRLVGEARWVRADDFMARRGGVAVFTGRWLGVMRALVPAVAGMARMPYRRFLFYNAAGGLLWATTVVMAGYFAGGSWQRLEGYLGRASAIVLVALAVLAAVVLAGRWVSGHRHRIVQAGRRLVDSLAVRRLRRCWQRPLAFAARRLRLGAMSGLTAGLLIVGAFAAAFTILSGQVLEAEGVANLDRPVNVWLATHRGAQMNAAMQAVTQAGSFRVLPLIAASAAAVVAWRTRSWLPVVTVAVTAAGAVVITATGKCLIGRDRPSLVYALTPETGYAFPSGHATSSAAVLGVCAWLLCRSAKSWHVNMWTTTGTIVTVTLIGFSRLYLGVHWLTDVLAAWLLASAWLTVVITATRMLTWHGDAGNPGHRVNRRSPSMSTTSQVPRMNAP